MLLLDLMDKEVSSRDEGRKRGKRKWGRRRYGMDANGANMTQMVNGECGSPRVIGLAWPIHLLGKNWDTGMLSGDFLSLFRRCSSLLVVFE